MSQTNTGKNSKQGAYNNLQSANNAYEELQERFFQAVDEGEVDEVENMITEEKVDPNMKEKERGTYAIIEASAHGHLPVVQLLLEKGANINSQGLENVTALMKAVQNGHSDVVRFLVVKGADKTIQNTHGKTALDLANSAYQSNLINANGSMIRLHQRIQEVKNILQAGGRRTITTYKKRTRQTRQKSHKSHKSQKSQKSHKSRLTKKRSRRN